MENEEDLFGLVSLTEKDVVIEEVQALQSRDDVNQEVLRLVSEETDTFDNLTMSGLNDISSK